jgi:DNA-binding IclR family transcriptional regulator
MSAPVFDHRGEPALMLLLLGPPYELTAADIAHLGDQLRAAAARVTQGNGGAAPAPE